MGSPEFSIITPSFRNSDWLRLCISSVSDQGVSLEHIVQDAGSDDGTLDWLPQDHRVSACIEKDSGMYDAVNRGLRRARGRILAYLNCDEQYLPGALQKVSGFFRDHPKIEILFGDVIAVDTQGQFLCYRKMDVPLASYTRASGMLSTLTCGMFLRRSVLEQHRLWFDPSYRVIGDADWVVRARQKHIPMSLLGEYTSTFTLTGDNLNLAPAAEAEKARFRDSVPPWLRLMKPMLVAHHRLRRWLGGAYRQDPFEYSIFTLADSRSRRVFEVRKPSCAWPV